MAVWNARCVANDDITAVIACFNLGRYLREAVDSAVAQGARAVVVDDGSTDANTREVLESLPPQADVPRKESSR